MKKPIKVATAKALKNLNYKLTEIAEILDIGERTAHRYVHEETNEHWQEFGTHLERLLMITENKASAEALAAIRKKTPKAEFKDLTSWYKTIRELRQPKSPTVAQQFNIGGEMGIEFVKDEQSKTT